MADIEQLATELQALNETMASWGEALGGHPADLSLGTINGAVDVNNG